MNSLKNKKILVIGGCGFIGSHVVEELLKEKVKKILIFDNFSRGKKNNIENFLRDKRVEIYPNGGDIRDIDVLNDAMKGIDYVIHLAALWLLHCKDYPRAAFKVNIEGTFNVLETCVKNKIKRLIYSSSASVYGDAIKLPMTEEHPFNNKNFYGATKISSEAMCRAFYDRYKLNYVGLRYMNVYGPRQDQKAAYNGVIPNLLDKIDKNQPLIIDGDGSQSYDFINVEDAARCNVLALKSQMVDKFYNVGTGKKTSIKNLCKLIVKLKKKNTKITFKPYKLDDARRQIKNRVSSTKLSRKDLKFKYKYSLKNGLKKLILWRNKSVE
ncbi:MAG: NAD-dependent epimerase/dehydratase family protein [Flavobacteriales bacterium TMED235]|nr:MAG: NAD-dependent epimerase/dehydratase family protein [Flavobacteriales bacterium TMED235]|tara:strand:+ start:268 stop:1242 length:975 start_codon:yes stop_codon:yes gene_type:complete